jgi:hypothetical protein
VDGEAGQRPCTALVPCTISMPRFRIRWLAGSLLSGWWVGAATRRCWEGLAEGQARASRRRSRRESLVKRDSRRRRVEERFEENNGAVAQLFSKNVVPMNCQFMV